MPPFGDLKTKKSQEELNGHLKHFSYVDGFLPSQDDVNAFQSLGGAPAADLPYAVRWFNHIKSFSADERSKWSKGSTSASSSSAHPTKKPQDDEEEEDEIDLFGDDDEDDEEKERIKEERLKAYADKKSKKPGVIAKSSIILDVKPWGDETDLKEMERLVRGIVKDGLIWGPSKIIPIAYGIQKLQIGCVVEDDKIGTDFLEEEITQFEDYVQSVDIAAFNKI